MAAGRCGRGNDARSDRHSRTVGDGAPRRHAADEWAVRLRGGLHRICGVRRQPLHVGRGGLDDRAHHGCHAGRHRRRRYHALRGRCRDAGAAGRRGVVAHKPAAPGLGSRPVVHSGDDRISRRDLRPYHRRATAHNPRRRRSARRSDSPACQDRAGTAARQSLPCRHRTGSARRESCWPNSSTGAFRAR